MSIGSKNLLNEIDLIINGKNYGIIAPNGCGKTTLSSSRIDILHENKYNDRED